MIKIYEKSLLEQAQKPQQQLEIKEPVAINDFKVAVKLQRE